MAAANTIIVPDTFIMSADSTLDFREKKKQLREQAHAARNAQTDKDPLSQRIVESFVALPEYQRAKVLREGTGTFQVLLIESVL